MLYNKLETEAIRIGAAIRVPLDTSDFSRNTVALHAREPFSIKKAIAEAPPPRSPEPRAPPPRAAPRHTAPKARSKVSAKKLGEELERAERLYGDGEYQAAAGAAEKAFLDADGARDQSRIELLRVLAFAQIALGDYPSSKSTFRKIPRHQPEVRARSLSDIAEDPRHLRSRGGPLRPPRRSLRSPRDSPGGRLAPENCEPQREQVS